MGTTPEAAPISRNRAATKSVHLRLEPDQYERVRRAAEEAHASKADVIRAALDDYLAGR